MIDDAPLRQRYGTAARERACARRDSTVILSRFSCRLKTTVPLPAIAWT